MMGLFGKIFKRQPPKKEPEAYYDIIITDKHLTVEHPERKTERINWNDIDEIAIITTDEGPFLPDVWLVLIGKDGGCSLPQGAPKYEDVFNVISTYEGFNFEEYIQSASCTQHARFELWKRKAENTS